jgi:hypothetical protein
LDDGGQCLNDVQNLGSNIQLSNQFNNVDPVLE